MTILTFLGKAGEVTLPYTVEYLSQSSDGDELVATGLIEEMYPFYYTASQGKDEFFVSWQKDSLAYPVLLDYKAQGYHISCADEGDLLGLYGYGLYNPMGSSCTVSQALCFLHQHMRPIALSTNYRRQKQCEEAVGEPAFSSP